VNVGEFSWKHANLNKGIVSAALHGVKYLVLPLVLIMFASTALSNFDAPRAIETMLLEIQTLVLIFGTVLLVLGFFKGAYPKGSYSRLTFGMTVAVLAIFYAFSLLLDGRLEEELADAMFELDLYLLFALYFIGAAFNVLVQFGEFVDHRRSWMEGTEHSIPQEKEDPKEHRWIHDFRIRYGSLFNGLRLSRRNLIGFVIIPLVFVIVLKAALSSIDLEQLDQLASRLDSVATFMLMLGLPITALAFFKGFYPKGSVSRFLPALGMVLICLYWIWVLGLEGRLAVDVMDGVVFGLDYSGLLLIIMCGTALWIVYYILELWLYRPEWKDGGFQKDIGKKKERQKKRKDKDDESAEVIETATSVVKNDP